MAADASFAIEIAAQMGDAEATIAELDEMVSAFTGAGKHASAFQEAIQILSSDLNAATAAQAAANEALSAGQAEYSRLEQAATQAAKAAERAAANEGAIAARAAKMAEGALAAAEAQRVLESQLNSVNAALSASTDFIPPELVERADSLTVALAKAKVKTDELTSAANDAAAAEQEAALRTLDAAVAAMKAKEVVDKYSDDLRVLEKSAEGAAREEARLAQTLNNVKRLGSHADKVIAKHAESLSKLGGALGAVGGPLGSIGQKLTAPIKGFTELSGVMGSTNAAALLAVVGVGALAAAVVAAGAAAVFAGGKLLKWAIKLADKEGRLAAQTDRLSTNFDDLFSGLNIEPVIEGMSVLADLFDKNTAAGETLKFLFESIFQPLVDQALNAAYVVEAFYLGFLIGALKLFLAVKPAIKAIGELFGFEDFSLADTLDLAKSAGEALAPVFILVAAVVGAAITVFAAMVAIVGVMVGAFIALPQVVGAALSAVANFVIGLFGQAVEFIRGIDFIAIGTSIMQGLASGITNAAGVVWSAITGAVKGAINAAKSMLGIASPSKVFADIGVNTGEGMTSGVEESTAAVQGAFEEMAAPPAMQEAEAMGAALAPPEFTDTMRPVEMFKSPDMGAGLDALPDVPAPAESPAAAPSGGASRDFSGATFVFQGVQGAEDAEKRFREMLLMSDEELALSLGAGEAVP